MYVMSPDGWANKQFTTGKFAAYDFLIFHKVKPTTPPKFITYTQNSDILFRYTNSKFNFMHYNCGCD